MGRAEFQNLFPEIENIEDEDEFEDGDVDDAEDDDEDENELEDKDEEDKVADSDHTYCRRVTELPNEPEPRHRYLIVEVIDDGERGFVFGQVRRLDFSGETLSDEEDDDEDEFEDEYENIDFPIRGNLLGLFALYFVILLIALSSVCQYLRIFWL